MKKNWSNSQHVGAFLAILVALFSFYIIKLILLKEVKSPENVTFLIVGIVSANLTTVVGYFFGSSAGSKAKQDSIDRMTDISESETTITTKSKTDDKQG